MPKPRMSPDEIMNALAGPAHVMPLADGANDVVHWCRLWRIDDTMPYQGITACGIRHNKTNGVIAPNVDPYLASDGTTIAVARKSELITCRNCLADLKKEKESPI